jgi:peptidoglycan-N-acetylglucosamine deacetylase
VFTEPAPVTYIASGAGFPDALAAGAVAGGAGGPLLLTRTGELPDATLAALLRLRPQRIVVLGGASVVGDTVLAALAQVAPGVERVWGPDRFATAAAVSLDGFPDGAPVVYLATGRSFPDALAAGPAAAEQDGPLLLVERDAIPEAVRLAIERLHPRHLVVLGGPAAVADDVLTAAGSR